MTAVLPAGAHNRVVVADDTVFDGAWSDLAPWSGVPAVAAFLTRDLLAPARAAWLAASEPHRETLIATAARVGIAQQQEWRDGGMAIVRWPTAQPDAGHDDQHVDHPEAPREPDAGRVWLLTSGSTGRPKQVAHTIDSLTTVATDQPPRTWLCPYTPGAYAWWQVVTLSLSVPGQDIVFVDGARADIWPHRALEAGVTAASGTPTFWRQAIFRSGETLAQLPLEQITLGGEPVDQAILDQLGEMFPDARLSWIYASSEAGAAIAVHDGQAGFPSAWLDRHTPGRPQVRVVDGELVIVATHGAQGMDTEIRTGDRADTHGDRVLITGRLASDEINVGGAKVSAAEVRGVLLQHPEVLWAHVRGRKAPIVGQMVQAEVVPAGAAATDGLTDRLTRWCRDRLPEYAVPRRIRVLSEIPIKETLKSDV
ncbi:AMP-binding protein [Demetria terragena]|uniref:AMP-binding protein n=1 Tax=Demetria terragena TaxID=63959 RepID=UPI000378F23F|nr:class I adenylate-forming enzyme family protein [Demetria terragena]